MARGCGVGVQCVSIAPEEHSGGRVMGFDPAGGLRCRYRTDQVMVSWAGPLAEERAVGLWQHRPGLVEHLERGQLEAFGWMRGDEHRMDDMRKILDLSLEAQMRERTAATWMHYLRCRTLDLLEHPEIWDQVAAVALALWEHETLTGRRLHAICRAVEDLHRRDEPAAGVSASA
jgi:hypothetical protein